jgi:hypothetical protein
VVVGDDEHAVADPRPGRRGGERLRARQRVSPLPFCGQVRELVDPEERGTGDMRLEVRLAPGLDALERVAAVDEPVRDQ